MKAIAIAGINLRRFLRDRSNIFFVFVLPLGLVLILGSLFGGSSTPKLGVVVSRSAPLAAQLVDGLHGRPGHRGRLVRR